MSCSYLAVREALTDYLCLVNPGRAFSAVKGRPRSHSPTASKAALAMAAGLGPWLASPLPRKSRFGRFNKTVFISGVPEKHKIGSLAFPIYFNGDDDGGITLDVFVLGKGNTLAAAALTRSSARRCRPILYQVFFYY